MTLLLLVLHRLGITIAAIKAFGKQYWRAQLIPGAVPRDATFPMPENAQRALVEVLRGDGHKNDWYGQSLALRVLEEDCELEAGEDAKTLLSDAMLRRINGQR